MIEIRPDQMQMFLEQVRSTFVSRVAAYLRAHHRSWVQEMDNTDLQSLVRRQIAAAETYGITTEVPVVQFIEIGLAYGEQFHASGQYPEAERILTQDVDGLVKMQQLKELAEHGLKAAEA